MKTEQYAPLAFLAVAVFFLIYSTQYRFGSFSAPGVCLFPTVCAGALAIVSLFNFVKGIKAEQKSENRQETEIKDAFQIDKVLGIIAIIAIFGLLHKFAGFWVSIFFAMVSLLKISGVSFKFSIIGGCSAVAVGYLVFEYWMGAYFPLGFLEKILN